MSRTVLRLAAPLLLGLVLIVSESAAVNIPSGGPAIPLAGTTAAATPDLAGVVVEDAIRPFAVGPFKGHLQDRVVRSNVSGALHFYYRIVLDPQSVGRVTGVRKAGFGPAAAPTDSDWRVDGLGTRAPKTAQRSADGQWVSFNHAPPGTISTGESSRFVFIKTKAKQYQLTGQTVILFTGAGPGGSVTLKTFRPVY
jgi:hypothetical protein